MHARKHLGLFIAVPESAWGGQWSDSSKVIRGMIVKYHGGGRLFTMKFPEEHAAEPEHISWEQMLGEAQWNGVLLALDLQPALSFGGELTLPSSKRPPATADCWDMRRGDGLFTVLKCSWHDP